MFDAPLPQNEAPRSPRRGSRPGRRYGSSMSNALVAVAGGLAVSALVFVGASAMLRTPSTTTIPAGTNTPVTTPQQLATNTGSQAPAQTPQKTDEGSRAVSPTTTPTSIPPTPTTVPTYHGDDNEGGSPTGEGESGGERDN